MIESIEDVREKDWATRDSHVVETASSRLFTAPPVSVNYCTTVHTRCQRVPADVIK
jgi:hypothetical protein